MVSSSTVIKVLTDVFPLSEMIFRRSPTLLAETKIVSR